MVPVAVAAWAGAWLGTGWGWFAGAGAALGACVVAAGWVRRSWLVSAVGIALLGCVLTGAARAWRVESSPVRELAADHAVAVVEGDVVTEPRVRQRQWNGSMWSARFRLTSLDARGTQYTSGEEVLLTAKAGPAWDAVEVGTRLRVTVGLSEPFDIANTVAVAQVRGDPELRGGPGAVLGAVAQVRAGLKQSVPRHSPEATALVPALVVGDTSAIATDLADDFSATGLTHLTAVSGANLTLLLAFLGLASRWMGVRGWWLRGVSVVGVVVFVLLCRAEPSVIRAAAMGLVALASLGRSGGRVGMRALAVAVSVIMVLDPWMSRSWGFGLSALATGGIIWWARRWAENLGVWLPRLIAEAITLPLAAQVATLPAVAALSGQLSVVSLAANLLAGPLVGPATVLGFLAAGASVPAPGVASVFGWAAGWCAQGIVWVARFFVNAPGAVIEWPADTVSVAVLVAACLAAGAVMSRVLSRRWLSVVCALAIVMVGLWGPPRPGWPPGSWRVAACDVGQGDAYLMRAGPSSAVMIDTGPDPRAASACLRQLGITAIPVLVLTHYHSDHIGGLSGVLSAARVDHVFVNPAGAHGDSGRAVAAALRDAAVQRRVAQIGDVAAVGWASFRVLDVGEGQPAEVPSDGEESSAENDTSIAVRAELAAPGLRPISILLAGDREPEGQRSLLTRGVPRVDVLAVPHHGSRRQDPLFLAATGAAIALISVGEGNGYGHPARSTVSALEHVGMRVFRTDRQGALVVSGGADDGLTVSSER